MDGKCIVHLGGSELPYTPFQLQQGQGIIKLDEIPDSS